MVTNEMKMEVIKYFQYEDNEELVKAYMNLDDAFYKFYYRCMKEDMHCGDADRYAILNTLFGYDIGMENARSIDQWMYEHDEEIFELSSKEGKSLVALAVAELGLCLDFSKWIKEDYKEYHFFEK